MEESIAYVVCAFNDIPSQRARGFTLLVEKPGAPPEPLPLIVIRWGRHVFGYVNRCPHNQSRLDWEREQFLDPDGIRLMCGKHGALFELGTGNCVAGPCKGQSLVPVPLQVVENDICVTGLRLVEDEDDLAEQDCEEQEG